MTDPTDPLEAAWEALFDDLYEAIQADSALMLRDAMARNRPLIEKAATPRPAGVPIEKIVAAMADPLVGPMVDAMLERTPRPAGVDDLDRLALRWVHKAKDADAIHDAFHDGIAAAFREAATDVRLAIVDRYEAPRPAGMDRCPDCEHVQDEHRTPGGECVHRFCSCDQSFTLVRAALTGSEEPARE